MCSGGIVAINRVSSFTATRMVSRSPSRVNAWSARCFRSDAWRSAAVSRGAIARERRAGDGIPRAESERRGGWETRGGRARARGARAPF